MHADSERGTANELLALEQAIRELMDLVTGGLCDEKRELAGGRFRHVPVSPRDTAALYQKDLKRANR